MHRFFLNVVLSRMKMKYLLMLLSCFPLFVVAQTGTVKGVVKNGVEAVPFANVGLVGTTYGAACDVNGKFVINDVAVLFVIPIQSIDAADGLKQAMIAHLFVDIEIGSRWRVEACEQFVYHDEQAHLAWLIKKAFFDRFLELFHFAHRCLFWLIEMGGQHLAVDGVLA